MSDENPTSTETRLLISDADRPLAYLELSDEALGRFTRQHLIQCEQAHHRHAAKMEMPFSVVTSIHASIALYRLCDEANAATMTLTHEGVSWRSEDHGDWRITVERLGSVTPTSTTHQPDTGRE